MSTSGGRRADAVRNRQLALEAVTTLLAQPGTPLTVEAIANKAGLGVGTVVRAFGSKDALLDAAVSGLLEPVVERGREMLGQSRPSRALRAFLAELITFQSMHHGISTYLDGLDLPATTARRAALVAIARDMIVAAQADGTVRRDIDLDRLTTLISETAYAVARLRPASTELTDAYLTVLTDGLRPRRSAR
jgi:AcrR family transcriptional regulator